MKVLTVKNKVECMGSDNEPTVELDTEKNAKEDFNRLENRLLIPEANAT